MKKKIPILDFKNLSISLVKYINEVIEHFQKFLLNIKHITKY